ncbi:FapA family protein (plasmid) [Embleya sp. NBC_00888]|uniref:hypothetical protein n=1 Tax=Embleya sp. NBC_00888 TaxID=2975960 RepID=UPI002F90F809|nr:FapA family protein [Embleya sp. NBC_00888]
MASLNYEILIDPAPLQVSEPGGESPGAVYIVVTNQTGADVTWGSIEVRVPVGNAEGDLTTAPAAINARIEQNTATDKAHEPKVARDATTGVVRVTPRNKAPFGKAGSLVLVLDDFPVSAKPGVVLPRVEERPVKGAPRKPVILSLLKQAPGVPRNFRADKTLLGANDTVRLLWDGPDTFTYAIKGPDGSMQTVTKGTAGWEWSPKKGDEPKRDATYTLIATPSTGKQPGYFLTTTVHLLGPEFDSVTATAGMHTPWVKGTEVDGRIHFTPQGAEIRKDPEKRGILTADKAALRDLDTTGNAVVGGALTVMGDVDARSALTVTGDVDAKGGLSVTGDVDAKQNFRAARNVELNDFVTLGNVRVRGALSVAGDVDTQNGVRAAGNVIVGCRLIVTDHVEAGHDLHLAGKAVVGGDLTVGGRVDSGG